MAFDDPLADSIRFTHEAMNTTFSLRLRGRDEAVARGLATECFARIDALEDLLSRFRGGSDVRRINRLEKGETLYVSDECHECLLIAMDGGVRTGGLFDVTLGAAIEHRKSGAEGPPTGLCGSLAVHPDAPAVTCIEPGREVDLGGIGKGYSLDQLGKLLLDWGCDDALLAAGASSLLATGPAAWPVGLASEAGPLRIGLTNEALSASGVHIQGSHIVHPGGEGAMPRNPFRRVWVVADTAAVAEVWSTAVLLMEPRQAADLAAGDASVRAVHVDTEDGVRRIC